MVFQRIRVLFPQAKEREERLEIESAAERVVGLQKRGSDVFTVLRDRDPQNVPCGVERADERRVGVNFGGRQEKGPAKGILLQSFFNFFYFSRAQLSFDIKCPYARKLCCRT